MGKMGKVKKKQRKANNGHEKQGRRKKMEDLETQWKAVTEMSE